jgi:hypothetical protein
MNPAVALLAHIVGESEQTARRNEGIISSGQELVDVSKAMGYSDVTGVILWSMATGRVQEDAELTASGIVVF